MNPISRILQPTGLSGGATAQGVSLKNPAPCREAAHLAGGAAARGVVLAAARHEVTFHAPREDDVRLPARIIELALEAVQEAAHLLRSAPTRPSALTARMVG